ncbi:MAG: 4Fe-4S binding protein [Deltaproteobacteria bacterium]|nr:4Fe-4S binding protein [Deltaproteobacteria bacterium]
MKKIRDPRELEELRAQILEKRDPDRPCIAVTSGTSARAYGSEKLVAAFRATLKAHRLSRKVDLRVTGGQGYDEREPLVIIHPRNILYQRVDPKDAEEIVTETVQGGRIIERLLYVDPKTGEKVVNRDDIPFYRGQMPIVFGDNGNIDPTRIEDYFAIGGFTAFAKALTEYTPEEVIDIIKKSGLRGRGGGGFPTGIKWETCRNAPGEKHYVVCNADEGDPGAYMDRGLLEGNPHRILEGMMIGAYAIGSDEGRIYVRYEYPLATEHLRIGIKQLREYGLLGEDILGTGFCFDIEINRGGGAFVCGESTALMASIEGNAGEPRAKHIHTVESGLWDQPTNLNNVETWANVPLIINRGEEWYREIGTEGSKGTKIFSLVGKVNNTGLVEVPMGMSIREIVYDIGGGIPNRGTLKAVQTGGPSGGCIPASLIDISVDFDKLTEVGSMMGSGGMIVMDDSTCMVDIAKYFLNFLKDESCGKCTTCRDGIRRMYEILDAITRGEGRAGDIELLEELSWVVADASLCALGSTAPNPVLSTIRYFREEYEAHIEKKKCPAGVCKALITYYIDKKKCTACGICKRVCPSEAVIGEKKVPHKIDTKKCIRCGACIAECKFDAVKVR